VNAAGVGIIPVVGFLANGIAFTSGQSEVTDAFANVGTAAALADASREFKLALSTMQIAAKDYVAQPSDERAKAFEAARALTTSNFEKIAAAANRQSAQDVSGQVRQRLSVLRVSFDYLVEEQKGLGYSDNEGTRKQLDDDAAKVEQLISDGIQLLSDSERDWLMLALLMMRPRLAAYVKKAAPLFGCARFWDDGTRRPVLFNRYNGVRRWAFFADGAVPLSTPIIAFSPMTAGPPLAISRCPPSWHCSRSSSW